MAVLICLSGLLYAREDPYSTPGHLFHIERSKNKNLVCYDVNLTEGKLDTEKPLTVYWIVRDKEPGVRKELNAIQRQMAYGYKLVSAGDDTAEVNLKAYPERTLSIRKSGGNYICVITIAGQPAILRHLYVKAKEGSSLSVEYVELTGVTLDTHQPVSERIRQ